MRRHFQNSDTILSFSRCDSRPVKDGNVAKCLLTLAVEVADIMRDAAAQGEKPFDRVFLVLEAVVSAAQPTTVSEVAAKVSLPTPTVHRLVTQLVERGFLRKELGSKRVLAGPRLVEMGAEIVGSAMRADTTHIVLRSLASELGEHCQIGIVDEGEILYVDTARGAQGAGAGLSIEFQPGRRAPLHCTSIGKLYLASLPDAELRALIADTKLRTYTANTLVDKAKLLKCAREVRATGWAWNNEEYVVGIVGCAVPIVGRHGRLIAGLGLSAPSARVDLGKLKQFIPRLKSAASRISKSLA